MESSSDNPAFDLLRLYKSREVNRISTFADFARRLNPDELAAAYARTRHSAPRRHERNKAYFVDHAGQANRSDNSNRREEHLAMALCDASKNASPMALPTGGTLEFLDYQTPLKAFQKDKGIGKVDLFGLIDGHRSTVIELKVRPSTGRGDTPLRAYLEALAYCAIVEANAAEIASEATTRFGNSIGDLPPGLIVMAPQDFWAGYVGYPRAGQWWPVLNDLASAIDELLGLETHFIGLRNVKFQMGSKGRNPHMTSQYTLVSVAESAGE